jgi:hypothetical protein
MRRRQFHYYTAVVHYSLRSGRKFVTQDVRHLYKTKAVDFKSHRLLSVKEMFFAADRAVEETLDNKYYDWRIDKPLYVGYGPSRREARRPEGW